MAVIYPERNNTMKIEVYHDAIQETWGYLLLNMIPIFALGILLIVVALVALFKRMMKKPTITVLLILGIMASAFSIAELFSFGYDVANANFESYYGEFDYMQVSGNRKDIFDFPEKSDLYVRSVADLHIDNGVHSGYILYGRTSRWVIACSDVPFR